MTSRLRHRPTRQLRRLVRGHIEDDRAQLLQASRDQDLILSRTKRVRRLEVVGPAGSGKSTLAASKASLLAREGPPGRSWSASTSASRPA